MFGLRHAGRAGKSVTSAVTYIPRKSGLLHDDQPFQSLNYSDDLAGVELSCRADAAYEAMGSLLLELGL